MSEILRSPLRIPAAWKPAELAAANARVHPLSAAEAGELDAALERVSRRGAAAEEIEA